MKQTTNNTAKLLNPPLGGRGAYIAPAIELIVLDNEISLALESTPPIGPDESYNEMTSPDNFNNDPFKTTLA